MAKVEIARENGTLKLVRVGWDYHIVDYFPDLDLIKAVYSADRVGKEYREAHGFTDVSIRLITAGRKEVSARRYYQAIIRARTKPIEVLSAIPAW